MLQADTKGRWWIVGSAFTGSLRGAETEMEDKSGPRQEEFSTKLLELAGSIQLVYMNLIPARPIGLTAPLTSWTDLL